MNNIIIKLIIIFFIVTGFTTVIHAESMEKSIPNISIGISGTFGLSNVYKRKGDMIWQNGYDFGGAIIFEKMFSNRFGIHSGIWYTHTKLGLDFDPALKTDYNARSITIPVYLITSFNTESFSINILFGLNFSHVFYAELTVTEGVAELNEDQILDYINYNQVGVAGGLNFKFRISKFTDFFIGGISEFYFTNVMRKDDMDIAHVYNFRGITGFMFRTNIFPIFE